MHPMGPYRSHNAQLNLEDNNMASLERAIQLAVQAHAGQKDKGGEPYILHPLRLVFKLHGETERIVAALHDVVEDTDWTLERLRGEGFAEEVLVAIDHLTRRKNEPYEDFIERVNTNALARTVKIADLRDNLDESRLSQLADQDITRMSKYRRALIGLLGSHTTVSVGRG
jgi:(p)ppGpp synthase/HD superfamily hydrolase